MSARSVCILTNFQKKIFIPNVPTIGFDLGREYRLSAGGGSTMSQSNGGDGTSEAKGTSRD